LFGCTLHAKNVAFMKHVLTPSRSVLSVS